MAWMHAADLSNLAGAKVAQLSQVLRRTYSAGGDESLLELFGDFKSVEDLINWSGEIPITQPFVHPPVLFSNLAKITDEEFRWVVREAKKNPEEPEAAVAPLAGPNPATPSRRPVNPTTPRKAPTATTTPRHAPSSARVFGPRSAQRVEDRGEGSSTDKLKGGQGPAFKLRGGSLYASYASQPPDSVDSPDASGSDDVDPGKPCTVYFYTVSC